MRRWKIRAAALVFAAMMLCSAMMLGGCGNGKEQVLIYTSAEDYRVEYMRQRLEEEFP